MSNFIVFPGQGSQYSGMGKDWYQNFEVAQRVYEEASDACSLNLKKLCFESTDYDLKQTEITQPAILATTVAIFRVLCAENKIEGQLFAGHSLGEYSALVCGGALELAAAARLVRKRGLYMQEAVPVGSGSMSALVFKPKTSDTLAKAEELCAELRRVSGKPLSVANFNSPEQIVIAGDVQVLEAVPGMAQQERFSIRKVVPLPVSAPFHCEMMRGAADRLKEDLFAVQYQVRPIGAYIANVDAELHAFSESKGIADRLYEQIFSQVRWVQTVEKAISLGAKKAIEVGPGSVLSGLVKRISVEGISLETQSIDRMEGIFSHG